MKPLTLGDLMGGVLCALLIWEIIQPLKLSQKVIFIMVCMFVVTVLDAFIQAMRAS